jgi:hypothetical protein
MKINKLPTINLPTFEHKITETDGKSLIFDIIRKKNIVLTPEEWVRQHVIHLLISHYNYSRSLFQVEKGTTYNSLQKRTDIVVFNREGKPHLLVECKAPEIKINQYVIEQASRYNKTINAPFLAVTNGLKTFCFSVDFETGKVKQMQDLPNIL